MANSKTQTLNKKATRIKEIRDAFKNSNVELDDLVPLVEEATENYQFIKERLDNTLKTLEEKEKSIEDNNE